MKHKFKQGNWVRNSIYPNDFGKVLEFTSESYSKEVCLTNNGHCFLQWEAWEPQPNEWCWFWNNNNQPFLAQLDFSEEDEETTIYYSVQGLHGSLADLSDANYNWKHCEPFIGELPELYRDK